MLLVKDCTLAEVKHFTQYLPMTEETYGHPMHLETLWFHTAATSHIPSTQLQTTTAKEWIKRESIQRSACNLWVKLKENYGEKTIQVSTHKHLHIKQNTAFNTIYVSTLEKKFMKIQKHRNSTWDRVWYLELLPTFGVFF